jgi:transmembrane sensor
MNGADDNFRDEAVQWHLASLRDDMDWDGFTAWLEADSRHREAFDQVALADDLAARHGPSMAEEFAAEPAGQPVRSRWPVWVGGAVAASLVALLVVPQFSQPDPVTYMANETSRTVTLDDGSSVIVAPGSTLTVAGRKQDQLTLEGGAFFDIRHDPARNLVVKAGGIEVSDIGTSFDVQVVGPSARIEVAAGRVQVRGAALAAPIELVAGKQFAFDPQRKIATVAAVSNENVGEWRRGRLTYEATPLALVAADLARYAHLRLDITPAIRDRRFSGTLSLGNGDTAVRDLAQLMELALVRDGDTYRLEPAN